MTVHVAHVIGSLNVGGAERSVVNYLLAANKDEFRHSVVCLSHRGSLAPIVEAAGIPVVVMNVSKRRASLDLVRIAHWLRGHDVTVVHSHLYYSSLWARGAGILARTPVLITTEHGKELWKNPLQIWLARQLSRHTCRHIAVSQDGMRLRLEREGLPAEKLVHIANGVSLPPEIELGAWRRSVRAEFALPDDVPVVGTVGRTVTAKGYGDLLDAMKTLATRRPAPVWLMVGDGPERPGLLATARMCGLGANLIAAGERSDVSRLLAAMDVFVMPSHREGLPVALLEAMAASRACVVSDIGGMPEAVVPGACGLVVPAQAPDRLAAAIGELLDDPQRARDLGAAARRRISQEYGIASVAAQI